MHQSTRDTYNQSADQLSRHYDQIGSRDGDIDLAFTLAGSPPNADVFEIGCGNGRDARSILRHTSNYLGIDTSERMISIARAKVPTGRFVIEDATTMDYKGPHDLIFAIAIFRHLNLEEITVVLKKAALALKPNGILYISTMLGESYKQISRRDSFGTREMYLYNPKIIMKRCPPTLKKVEEIYDMVDGKDWFELALKKVN